MLRKAYLRKVEAKLEEWVDEISKLKGEAEKAGSDMKARYQEQLDLLWAKQRAAVESIRELREAGAGNWGKFKSATEEAVENLRKAVENAIAKLKKSA